MPGAAGKAMVDGGLLPQTDGPRGKETFAQWLQTDAAQARPSAGTSGAQ